MADISYYVTVICYLIAMGILAFATYRAFRIRRALAQPIYRSRALSLALMAVLYIIALLADIIVYLIALPSQTDFVTAVLITLTYNLPYFVFAFMMFTSVDRTILVAIDMDLLQRNTLRWKLLRLPLYAMVLGAIALILIANPFLYAVTPPDWANIAYQAFYPIYLPPLLIATFALFLSGRRSLERTMRRFVAIFAVSVAFFNADFILYNYVYNFNFTPTGQFVDNLVIITASYFLYRAIVSLTPLGKVEPTGATEPQ